MDKDIIFDTLLFISPKKLSISVFKKSNLEKIYLKEVLINNDSNQINFDKLNNFLDNNIYKIEKISKKFIKSIYLIIDYNDFLNVQLSIKKNNYGDLLTSNILTYALNEAKDQCKETFHKRRIIHFLINNYLIDEEYYSQLPKNKKCKNFSLDLKFICLSENLIKILEQTLKRYQISLNRIISADYIKDFFQSDKEDIFNLSMKIIDGCNENEISLVNKNTQNKGFFEKFFNFFS